MPRPHDLLTRYTFEQPERAAAELRAVLPPQVAALIAWSSLERQSGSVVDSHLKETQSDLLFAGRLNSGQSLLLYFLLEHQSSVERLMAFRLLRYVMRILERWLQQNPGSPWLPVVLPMVLYHGPEGRWTAPLKMEELFALPPELLGILAPLLPRIEYRVDDLTAAREEALRAREAPAMVLLTLLLLRASHSGNLAVLLKGWGPLLAQVLESPQAREDLNAILHYLLSVEPEAADEPLQQVLLSVARGHHSEEQMRTIREMLIDQGRQQGLAQGLAEGQASERALGVLRILESRRIAVDEQTRSRILSCTDLHLLEQWFDRALDATSISDLMMSP
jgi:predicted transposase/invertase (TIGR01784 family)